MVHNESRQLNQTITFLDKAKTAKMELDNEIKILKSTQADTGLILQLEKFYKEINLMIKVKDYNPSYPRIIVDSWNYDSKLGEQLLDLFEFYKRIR